MFTFSHALEPRPVFTLSGRGGTVVVTDTSKFAVVRLDPGDRLGCVVEILGTFDWINGLLPFPALMERDWLCDETVAIASALRGLGCAPQTSAHHAQHRE